MNAVVQWRCGPPGVLRDAHGEGLHRRSLWEARAIHGAARARSRLRGGRRVSGGKRGEARRVQGAHHRRSRSDGRRRGHQARGLRMRRGARRAGPAGRPRVLDGNGPGGARPRASGRAPRVLVRVAHHARRPGRVFVEAQGDREGLRPARAPGSLRRPRRPGGACRRVFASDTRWTVVRGATSRRARARACPCGAGTSATPSSRATSPAAWTLPCSWWSPPTNELVHEAPAIVGRQTPSALAHAANE